MKSDRINLINCDEKLLKIILKGDDFLSEELGVFVTDNWSEFGNVIFEFTLQKIQENPDVQKWFSYLPIDSKSKIVLGTCGFKGEPDEDGMVEIGYEVAEKYRNQGYATEITRSLIQVAFGDSKVIKIQAHTKPNKNASVRVLEKCNFKFIKEYKTEAEEGLVWQWIKERDLNS